MMRAATVYRRGNALYLNSSSRTTAGLWIATAPFLRVESGSALTARGEAALAALNASQEGVPHPTNWSELVAPLLELAGVRSWATFMKGAACLNLEVEGESLKIIPNRNLGPKEGFESIPESAVELPFPSSPGQIGVALEEALARCQRGKDRGGGPRGQGVGK
jgi:hypothetical protein